MKITTPDQRVRGSFLHPIAIALGLLIVAIPAGMAVFDWTAGVMDRRYVIRLTSGHEATRRSALVQMQELPPEQIRRLNRVAHGMLLSNSPLQRARALFALSVLGGREFRAEVEQRLRRDRSEMVRFAAATSLFRLGDPAAVPTLCQALHDRNRVVRWAAARSLGAYALNDSFRHMIWCLPDDADRSPLLELAVQSSLDPLHENGWRWLLESANPIDRRLAHRAVTITGIRAAAPDIALDLSHRDPTVRASACMALALMGQGRYLDAIRPLLNDPDVRVRCNALRAAGMLHDPETVARCRQILARPTSPQPAPVRLVRGPVALFEGPGHETFRLPFRTTFRMEVPLDWEGFNECNERWSAMVALIGSQAPETEDLLLPAVLDADDRVAEAAVHGLAQSRRPETYTQMESLLNDHKRPARLRRRAVEWLGTVAPDASVPMFIAVYQDETERVATDPDSDELVRDLVRFLGRLRARAALPVMLQASRNPDREVRLAAVHGLASVGGEEARARLQDLSDNDYDEIVSLAATREVGRLNGRRQDTFDYPMSPRQ